MSWSGSGGRGFGDSYAGSYGNPQPLPPGPRSNPSFDKVPPRVYTCCNCGKEPEFQEGAFRQQCMKYKGARHGLCEHITGRNVFVDRNATGFAGQDPQLLANGVTRRCFCSQPYIKALPGVGYGQSNNAYGNYGNAGRGGNQGW